MNHLHSTTSTSKKGTHLSYEERVQIKIRLKDGFSMRAIARELGRSHATIINEVRRGMEPTPKRCTLRYNPKAGQKVYELNRENSARTNLICERHEFIKYVEKHVKEDKWSFDVCCAKALLDGEFTREEIVCYSTLYNYADRGLIAVKNCDLLEKVKRKTSKEKTSRNKRVLGRSIDERPADVDLREEFGHWECDLVLGKQSQDAALFVLMERKSRYTHILKIKDKEATTVMNAFEDLKDIYGTRFSEVFKTITTDNGSEFAELSSLEACSKTKVYFAHPYSSYEKGTIERQNRIIRRFVPKKKRISEYTDGAIDRIELWCNALPRKRLGYMSAEDIFEQYLDEIYAA